MEKLSDVWTPVVPSTSTILVELVHNILVMIFFHVHTHVLFHYIIKKEHLLLQCHSGSHSFIVAFIWFLTSLTLWVRLYFQTHCHSAASTPHCRFSRWPSDVSTAIKNNPFSCFSPSFLSLCPGFTSGVAPGVGLLWMRRTAWTGLR